MRVIHPSWRVWQVRQSAFEGDADNVYGKEIARSFRQAALHISRGRVRGYRDAGKDCECADKRRNSARPGRSLWRRSYDGRCGFCSRWVKYWEKTLTRRGFAIASLEEPWVAGKLEMPHEKLLTDIRLLTADDRLISGATFIVCNATNLVGLAFLCDFSLPGFNRLIQVGYGGLRATATAYPRLRIQPARLRLRCRPYLSRELSILPKTKGQSGNQMPLSQVNRN